MQSVHVLCSCICALALPMLTNDARDARSVIAWHAPSPDGTMVLGRCEGTTAAVAVKMCSLVDTLTMMQRLSKRPCHIMLCAVTQAAAYLGPLVAQAPANDPCTTNALQLTTCLTDGSIQVSSGVWSLALQCVRCAVGWEVAVGYLIERSSSCKLATVHACV